MVGWGGRACGGGCWVGPASRREGGHGGVGGGEGGCEGGLGGVGGVAAVKDLGGAEVGGGLGTYMPIGDVSESDGNGDEWCVCVCEGESFLKG